MVWRLRDRPATMWTVEDQIDSSAKSTGNQRLPMRTKGVGLVFSLFLLYAGIAVIGVVGSVAFLVRAFVNTAGKCEAGWAGGVGLSVSFMAGGYIFGSLAFRGLRATATASRNVGGVEIDQHQLVIDSPGVLSSPVAIHRDWISTIATLESKQLAEGAPLTLCLTSRFTVITLRETMGLPSAVGVPGFVGVVSINPPRPWQEVGAVSVDLEDPAFAQAALTEWLDRPSVEPVPPMPQPTIRDRTRLYRMITAIVLGFGGLAVLVLSLPTGSGC